VLEIAVCCKIVVASKTVSSEATNTCSNKAARHDILAIECISEILTLNSILVREGVRECVFQLYDVGM